MQTHEPPSFQPAASSLKTNPPDPRLFEDYTGQELDSLSTNPFPPRPHEVWMGEPRGGSTNPFPRRPHEVYMGEPKIARKPISPPVQAEATLDPEASPYIFGNRPFRMNPPDAPPPPPPRRWGIQAKLAIGQPNDVYEQEADRVAEQVMGMGTAAPPTVQRQAEEEEPEEIQTKPLAEAITPLVQRQADLEEDEPIQPKCETCEAEEPIQRFADGTAQAQPDLENRLNASQGGGSALPDDVRSFMEPRFKADFSQVRVHTDSEAVQMNQDLNAQAFTHQQDIYFGSGKAPGNDALTAHELTHVVQQTNLLPGIQAKQDLKSQVSDILQLACLPATACPSTIPGAAGDFGAAESTAEVGPRGRRASMSPTRQRSTGHVGHARQLEQFLNAQSPGLLSQIHGIFIDQDMSPGTGALTMPCGAMVPPITGAVLPCVFVHGNQNQAALTFNTTPSPTIGGISRENWRVSTLQTLTHEIQHVIFDSAAHANPVGASCARADVDFELSELNAIMSEFPIAFRAIPAGASSSHPAKIHLANWFSNAITNPSESIAGILHDLRCRCNCSEVNAYVIDTFNFVTGSWSAVERSTFNTELRKPHWHLDWPL